MPIVTVALHGYAAGLTDSVFKRSHGLLLRCRRPCHVENLFLQNCAVQIVHAVAERDLCERQSQTDPVSGQVVDVIQVNSAHREIAELFECGGAFYVSEDPMSCRRLERKGNKASEPARLTL